MCACVWEDEHETEYLGAELPQCGWGGLEVGVEGGGGGVMCDEEDQRSSLA